MKRHGRRLNAYDSIKEFNLKRLHTVWFQLYEILEKAMETVIRSVDVRGLGREKDEQAEHRGFLGQWKYSVWYCSGR